MNDIEQGIKEMARQTYYGELPKREPVKCREVALFYWMLFTKRNYVIEKIKNPLRQVLESGKSFKRLIRVLTRSASLLPEITDNNLVSPNARILKEKTDELLRLHHNKTRGKMIEAGCKMLIAEVEHDAYYAFLFNWLLIEMAMELARGNYKPVMLQFPPQGACWAGQDLPDIDTIRLKMKEALNEKD